MTREVYREPPTLSEFASLAVEALQISRFHKKTKAITDELGLPWYSNASIVLHELEQITQKKTPKALLPITTNIYQYMRVTDDWFDGQNQQRIPSWKETRQHIRPERTALIHSIAAADLEASQKSAMARSIGALRLSVYAELEKKTKWEGEPDFDKAYAYRLATTGAFSRMVADVWCLGAGATPKENELAANCMEKVGMLLQYIDDFTDIHESPNTGNLLHAILQNNEAERYQTHVALRRHHSEANLLDLLEWSAPETVRHYFQKIQEEVALLDVISPRLARALNWYIKFTFPRYSYEEKTQTFGSIQVW